MVSKPLAFGLLVGACVVAAGGGAYVATLHNARSAASAAASARAPAIPSAPLPVESGQATSTIPTVPSAAGDQGTARVGGFEAPAASAPTRATPAKSDQKAQARREPKVEAPPVTAQPTDLPLAAQGTSPVAVPAPQPVPVDPGSVAQRPWPGPPTTTAVPVSGGFGSAEPVRPDLDAQVHDNVNLWEELVVPAESVLGLQLESTLNTEQARLEDRVDAHVTRDVRVRGRVAIPAGARVVGSVMLVERGGKMKDRARIGIRFHTLVLADGTKMPISTDTLYRESESPGNKASAKIGGAAIGGAIIGAIIGGGKGAAIGSGIGAAGGTAAAMTSDRMAVVLPAGTTVSVRTQAPIAVTVEK